MARKEVGRGPAVLPTRRPPPAPQPPARGGRPPARTRAGSPLPIERGAAPRCGAAVGATLGQQTGQASRRSFPRRPVLPGARP